jgi:hypothetical protein
MGFADPGFVRRIQSATDRLNLAFGRRAALPFLLKLARFSGDRFAWRRGASMTLETMGRGGGSVAAATRHRGGWRLKPAYRHRSGR